MSVPAESGLIATIMPEVCYPNVDANTGLAPSPVSEFLADEEAASTCPLLTPSPPAEFDHPLSTNGMAYERQISPTSIDELTSIPALNGNMSLGFVNDMPVNEHNDSRSSQETQQEFKPAHSVQSVMESSSSSSSVTQEPTVCAQLLSSHHYQHLTKASDVDPFACQENGGKPALTGIQLAVRKSPDDFCFMDWNWPLIRKFSFWGAISLLVACVCIVITLIAGLPTSCNPEHEWWQGTVFYEVFPASFKDDDGDGTGDLRGLGKQATYFTSLGVQVIRLNSIFQAEHYPENYEQIQNLTEIASVLGTMRDFKFAMTAIHGKNISVVLDIPISPFIKQISRGALDNTFESDPGKSNRLPVMDLKLENESDSQNISAETINRVKRKEDKYENVITSAIKFWLQNDVDGIYLKGLEYLVDEPNFVPLVQEWKKVIKSFNNGLRQQKILMCSMDVINALHPDDDAKKVHSVLSNVDLVDVKLDIMNNGTKGLKKQVDKVIKLFAAKPNYPWIHWHIGSVDSKRLTSQLPIANASIAAIWFEMMLPGTPSIFYGDEIGLEDYRDAERERADISHVHHLPVMHWTKTVGFSQPHVLSWLPPSSAMSSVEYGQQIVIQMVSKLRSQSPSIYMNGLWKEHEYIPNYEIRTVDKDIVLVERSYPRRNSFVVVSNFGSQTKTKDLSFIYYGGEVMADQRGRLGQYLTFHALTLYAGESIIIKLDK